MPQTLNPMPIIGDLSVMVREAWRLAFSLYARDGLGDPALILWDVNDKVTRLIRPTLRSQDDLGSIASYTVSQTPFDHAILVSRSVMGPQPPDDFPEPDLVQSMFVQRNGLALVLACRSGFREIYFAPIDEIDGVPTFSQPFLIPQTLTPLDAIFDESRHLH
jgi:hypothetical protein